MQRLIYLTFFSSIAFLSCKKDGKIVTKNIIPANSVLINGTYYSTVVIGNQTWTSVNYNGPGGVNYDSVSTNNPVQGKLYTYNEAANIQLPAGWRLPVQSDFDTLLAVVGNTAVNLYFTVGVDTLQLKLMSKTGWVGAGGSNSSGFNAVPAGYYGPLPASLDLGFYGQGRYAVFVSSYDYGSFTYLADFAIYQIINENQYGFELPVGGFVTARGSVRFVKDN